MKFRLCLFLLTWSLSLSAQSTFTFPPTPLKNTSKIYFGTTITDNYAWLQHTEDAEVRNWVDVQRTYTDSFLNAIPFLNKMEKNIESKGTAMLNVPPSGRKYSLQLFARTQEAMSRKAYGKSVPILYYREKEEQQWKVLIDPLKYASSENENINLTNYSLSDDGNNLAFGLSRNGSDWQEIHVLDMNTREATNDTITWVKSSDIVWYKDGFFYKRIMKPASSLTDWSTVQDERIYYHRLHTAEDIKTNIDDCRSMEIPDNKNLVIYGGSYVKGKRYYTVSCLDISGDDWQQKMPRKFISYPYESRYNLDVLTIRNDSAIVRNNLFAGNGFVGSFDIRQTNAYRTLIPEYDEVLTNAYFKLGKLHCIYRNDSGYLMYRFDLNGHLEEGFDFGHFMSVYNFKTETPQTAYYREMSFDRPPIQYKFNFETYTSDLIGTTSVGYDVNSYISRQVTYRSSDSVAVQMTLFYKKGLKISEKTPVLLTAYGGFGDVSDPSYDYAHILWAESGGIYAVAHIRGGGERGSSWHMAGSRQRKQQCINDFVWAAKFLIENNYTSPAKLGITGSSHGGLVVAAAINQHPELFGAAIPVVGVYDMLNYQDYTIGKWTSDEFGTSADSASFVNLYGYSPYHNIRSGITYPSVLVMTGDHDDRVPPFHSYKYIAALQASSAGEKPALLYVNTNAGHNGGQNKKDEIREKAVKLAFLFHALNVKPVLMY